MFRYIKLVTSYLFVGVVFLYACRSNELDPELPSGYIELQAGRLAQTRAGVTVIADTVRDFICPLNAACIAPDNVSASLRLVKANESRSVKLHAWIGKSEHGGFTDDSASVVLKGQLYSVTLRGQYINSSAGGRRGRAILQVSRL